MVSHACNCLASYGVLIVWGVLQEGLCSGGDECCSGVEPGFGSKLQDDLKMVMCTLLPSLLPRKYILWFTAHEQYAQVHNHPWVTEGDQAPKNWMLMATFSNVEMSLLPGSVVQL